MKNPKYSIIIVHYKNEKDLIETLNTLYKFNPSGLFEVIIVDNSENTLVKQRLQSYKNLLYLNSGKNLGYGKGINYGFKKAKGEFLFVLNPDVIFKEDILSTIYKEFNKNEKVGIIAPLLLNSDGTVMSQGAKDISFFEAFIKFSVLDRIFPNNPISRKYWTSKWKKNSITKVDNVPGTAFVIKRELFEKINGFDEKFFLYFEEFDLCDRVRKFGYEIFIDSRLKLVHKWGTSTKLLENNNDIFNESRKYYFKKKFGLIKSIILNFFLSINFYNLLFAFLLSLAALIRFYKFQTVIDLGIGDQGWFYLSARDMIINHAFPLVGITSSHVWLHQGALWTYLLAIVLKISNFNPLSPILFSIMLDLITLTFLYKFTSKLFNKFSGVFAVAIYTFSSYVIMASRMPYHTSLIPLFTLFYIYFTVKWVQGNVKYFPLVMLSLSLLYNFELQTVIYMFITVMFFIYGLLIKKDWVSGLINKKVIALSTVLFILPLLPVIIYDLQNGFPQTFVFAGWIAYRVYQAISASHSGLDLPSLINFFTTFINKLLLIKFSLLSVLLLVISFIYGIYRSIMKKSVNFLILILIVWFLFLGIFMNKTPSDAYLYSLIIPLVLLVAAFIGNISKYKLVNLSFLVVIVLFMFSNVVYLQTSGYFDAYRSQSKYFSKSEAVKYIINDAKGEKVRLIGKGDGSQFASFLDYYKFLFWVYGGKLDQTSQKIYILYETRYGTKIIRGDNYAKRSNFN